VRTPYSDAPLLGEPAFTRRGLADFSGASKKGREYCDPFFFKSILRWLRKEEVSLAKLWKGKEAHAEWSHLRAQFLELRGKESEGPPKGGSGQKGTTLPLPSPPHFSWKKKDRTSKLPT